RGAARAPRPAAPLAGWSGTAPAPAAPGSAPCCAYLAAATVCRAPGAGSGPAGAQRPRGSGKRGSAGGSGRAQGCPANWPPLPRGRPLPVPPSPPEAQSPLGQIERLGLHSLPAL
uniref:Uncharacterized protein n=1 Tax=Peromyscus maniculatus bairdii TaxID=230844 RepID=A0A8C9CRF4_PERMB